MYIHIYPTKLLDLHLQVETKNCWDFISGSTKVPSGGHSHGKGAISIEDVPDPMKTSIDGGVSIFFLVNFQTYSTENEESWILYWWNMSH